MSSSRVRLTPTAEKDVRFLPMFAQQTVLRQIKTLENDVTLDEKRIKKLRGFKEGFFRLRIGDFRAIFRVESQEVRVHRVVNRKDLN